MQHDHVRIHRCGALLAAFIAAGFVCQPTPSNLTAANTARFIGPDAALPLPNSRLMRSAVMNGRARGAAVPLLAAEEGFGGRFRCMRPAPGR